MGGEPHQPIRMAELGSVDGLPGMVIARKVSSVVCYHVQVRTDVKQLLGICADRVFDCKRSYAGGQDDTVS